MTKKIKIILTITIILGVLFTIISFIKGIKDIYQGLKYNIISDSSAKINIENYLGEIPQNASRLFFARCGFQDASILIAFSAPKEECIKFIKQTFGVELSEMQKTSTIPSQFINNIVSEKGDRNWDLEQYNNFQMYIDEEKKITILYNTNINRLYFYIE